MSSFITFKQYLIIAERFNILLEGRIQDDVYAILKKAGYSEEQIPHDFRTLQQLTQPYNSHKHLPMLAKYYVELTSDIEIVKSYYDRFMANPRLKNLDIFQFKNFHQFEQKIDSTATPVNKKAVEEIDDKPVYEDENVKIYYGSDKNRCIKYGQGKRFGFCISQDGPGNLFHGYRGKEATFYFVYFKNEFAQAGAPAELIVLHAYPDNRYKINYAIPNYDEEITLNKIESEFPALKGLLGADGVIKHQGHTEAEASEYRIRNARRMFDLKTKDEQLRWLEFHPDASFRRNEIDLLDEDHVAKLIETNINDLPHSALKRYPKHIPRYTAKRIQALEMLLEASHGRMSPDMLKLDEKAVVGVIENLKDIDSVAKFDYLYGAYVNEYTYKDVQYVSHALYQRYVDFESDVNDFIARIGVSRRLPEVFSIEFMWKHGYSHIYNSMCRDQIMTIVDKYENDPAHVTLDIDHTLFYRVPSLTKELIRDVKCIGTLIALICAVLRGQSKDYDAEEGELMKDEFLAICRESFVRLTSRAEEHKSLFSNTRELLDATAKYAAESGFLHGMLNVIENAEYRHDDYENFVADFDGVDMIESLYIDENDGWTVESFLKAVSEFGWNPEQITDSRVVPDVSIDMFNLFYCVSNWERLNEIYAEMHGVDLRDLDLDLQLFDDEDDNDSAGKAELDIPFEDVVLNNKEHFRNIISSYSKEDFIEKYNDRIIKTVEYLNTLR